VIYVTTECAIRGERTVNNATSSAKPRRRPYTSPANDQKKEEKEKEKEKEKKRKENSLPDWSEPYLPYVVHTHPLHTHRSIPDRRRTDPSQPRRR
jgi:hypothetical protein